MEHRTLYNGIKILIVTICSIMAIVCLVAISNINKIIKYDYRPVANNVKEYANCQFYNELNYQKQREFLIQHEDKLESFKNPRQLDKALEILYINNCYIREFGKRAFLLSGEGEEGFNNRKKELENVFKQRIHKLYPEWKSEYTRYRNIANKELRERVSLSRKLYCLTIFQGIVVYLLCFHKSQDCNHYAKNLYILNLICFVLATIGIAIFCYLHPLRFNTFQLLVWIYLPSLIIWILQSNYLSLKSKDRYTSCYLIPQRIINRFKIDSEYKKRLLMVLIFYPLFVIVPLPFVGVVILLCYVLPMIVICLMAWSIKYTSNWIDKGKQIDKNEY